MYTVGFQGKRAGARIEVDCAVGEVDRVRGDRFRDMRLV